MDTDKKRGIWMIREVEYFLKGGPKNTNKCLEIVSELIDEGFKHVVIASTSGDTGLKAAQKLMNRDVNLVVVTHSAGFKKPNQNELSNKHREEIINLGGKIYTGTILTHSIETSLMAEHSGIYPTYLITQTLRRICQGIKVGCEIVMEACDAGLIPEGEEVIAIGGTGKGADTVSIIKSAASKRFLELKVLEILAKPRE
jgi:hypothetical protein